MDKKTRARIGKKIKLRREQIGLEPQELARLLGISVSALSAYEMGTERIGAPMLLAIAKHLKAPIKFLFSDESEPPADDPTGFSEGALEETGPEEIVRLISAFEGISGEEGRLTVIELAENLARNSRN